MNWDAKIRFFIKINKESFIN